MNLLTKQIIGLLFALTILPTSLQASITVDIGSLGIDDGKPIPELITAGGNRIQFRSQLAHFFLDGVGADSRLTNTKPKPNSQSPYNPATDSFENFTVPGTYENDPGEVADFNPFFHILTKPGSNMAEAAFLLFEIPIIDFSVRVAVDDQGGSALVGLTFYNSNLEKIPGIINEVSFPGEKEESGSSRLLSGSTAIAASAVRIDYVFPGSAIAGMHDLGSLGGVHDTFAPDTTGPVFSGIPTAIQGRNNGQPSDQFVMGGFSFTTVNEPVPEPSSVVVWLLLISVGLIVYRRNRSGVPETN